MATVASGVSRPVEGADLDVERLETSLREQLEGEVRFDDGSRGLYATDASNYRQVPIGVVIPRSIEDVEATHEICHAAGAPILARGTGTSLSGETVNVAVIIDFSKYLTRIIEIDAANRVARVQPGVIHDQLTAETKRHGLVFAPDPSTHKYCTIGGNIGNNSCGIHSVQAEFLGDGPRTSDNLQEMEILTYDGLRMTVGPTTSDEFDAIVRAGGRRAQIYEGLRSLRDRYGDLIRERFPDIPRRVSGYNLDELLEENGFNVARALVGTEGTCANVLEATLKLVPNPAGRALVVVGYGSIFEAGDHISKIREHEPLGIEGMDHRLIANQKQLGMHPGALDFLPEGKGFLLIEVGGADRAEADEKAKALVSDLESDGDPPREVRTYDDQETERKLWEVREAGLGSTAFPPDDERDHWPGWEDSAVPPDKVGPYLRDLQKLYDRFDYHGAIYGHLGQGCIHSRISFDLRTAGGIETYRSFMEEAADLCVSYGGSLSGEHGDGQQRGELLPRMYGEELVEAFREFKRIWDPDWKMNPGKVVDPRPLDEDLKLAPQNYRPPQLETRFAYAEDDGDFAHATVRCVGVGRCRTPDSGTMCPSFQVTREEKHSTRGRARMLFEMLQGDPVRNGWKDEDVKSSLDLCLACKGCKSDCPVSVDMATYKAEFLSHYFEDAHRPRVAYAMGWIHRWARVAAKLPHLANLVSHAPVVGTLLKKAGGVTTQREAPNFATQTLRAWFEQRAEVNAGAPEVMVWPDTFNNFMHPEVGKAAIEVIEALGYRVSMPPRVLCCGRPLYDYGMLDLAESLLRQTLDVLRPQLVEGTPIVGIEPSCVAVFRDELEGLMPHDLDAQRLAKQFLTFSEFVHDKIPDGWKLERKAIVHPHCHHDAVMGFDADRETLGSLGLDVSMSEAGCCGLAGSFGFEAGEKFEVSVKAGERKLAPLVREQGPDTLIVADGFSCKTQIAQLTDRRALHTAQVLKMALQGDDLGAGGAVEDGHPDVRIDARLKPLEWAALGAAGLVTAGLIRAAGRSRRS